MHISKLLQDNQLVQNCEVQRVGVLNNKLTDTDNMSVKRNTTLSLLKSGFLNNNELVFLEFESEKFCIFYIDTGKIKRLKNKSSLENLINESYRINISLKIFSAIIPILNITFSPNEKKIFYRGSRTHFNKFVENDILSTRHNIKDDERLSVLNWSNYPTIKNLLNNLFVKDSYLNYFINWFSTILNTLEKVPTSIILKGVEGAGKGVLFKYIIRYIFGNDYTIEIGNDQLRNNFNSSLENRLFVVANEIKGDFKDGNIMYEKLKSYITEDTLIIELKGIDEIELENHFNMLFFTNNDVPLQISPTDRRYSVFTTNDVDLKYIVGVDKMDTFIQNIELERDNFLKDVIKFNYVKYRASEVIDTDDKQAIVNASTSKIDLLGNWFKRGKIDDVLDGVDELYNYTDKEIFLIFNCEVMTANLKSTLIPKLRNDIILAFDNGFLTNDLGITLYKIFVNHTDTTRKIGIALNTVLGKSEIKKINQKPIRGRKIKKIEEIPF